MTVSLKCKRMLEAWDETITSQVGEGPRISRASVRYTLTGTFSGASLLDYSMAYQVDGSTRFLGYEQLVGETDGEAASLILRHEGKYDSDGASLSVAILGGSGTGRFSSAAGDALIVSDPSDHRNSTLELKLS